MTIDDKIKQAAEKYAPIYPNDGHTSCLEQCAFIAGADVMKSEMLADMQKLAEALEYYNSLSDRVSVEYAYKDNTFCYNVVTDERLRTLATKALAEFNAKYKGDK